MFASILKGAPKGNHNAAGKHNGDGAVKRTTANQPHWMPKDNSGHEKWDVTHGGKGYLVTFNYHTGHPSIEGSRTNIVPSTATSVHPKTRTTRITVDPSGSLGKKIMAHVESEKAKG